MSNKKVLFGEPAETGVNEIVSVDADEQEEDEVEILSQKIAEKKLKKNGGCLLRE